MGWGSAIVDVRNWAEALKHAISSSIPPRRGQQGVVPDRSGRQHSDEALLPSWARKMVFVQNTGGVLS